jgi:hypothetical protein
VRRRRIHSRSGESSTIIVHAMCINIYKYIYK